MKKTLLVLLGAALLSGTAIAQAPETLDYLMINKLSPNGKWAYSEDAFNIGLTIINLETGEKSEKYVLNQPDGSSFFYEGGMGNSISNNGIVLANTNPLDMDAAYWENGEWKWLPLQENTPANGNNALGITPDGSRICGTITNPYTNYEIGNTCYPCVWDRLEDGTYGDPTILPYPELDITNRIPSMTRIAYISEDGKTILGQMRDYSGYLHFPIVYREIEPGKWEYELLHYNDLFLADNPGITECPSEEDQPKEIDPTLYMDEENAAAYDEAYAEFLNGGEWPNPGDYMISQAQVDAYNKAVDEYNRLAEEWNEKFYAFSESFVAYADKVPNLIFNSYSMSSNGKFVLAGGYYADYIFNLETGEYREVTEYGVSATQVTNDGSLIGVSRVDLDGLTRNAHILLPGAKEYISLDEYLAPTIAETATWIKENLTREMPIYKWDETGSVVVDEDGYPVVDHTVPTVITGQPCATDDLSVIATWTYDSWTVKSDTHEYYTHIYDIAKIQAGVNEIVAEESEAPAIFYNLQGVKVPAENLAPGIYVKRQGQKVEKIYMK